MTVVVDAEVLLSWYVAMSGTGAVLLSAHGTVTLPGLVALLLTLTVAGVTSMHAVVLTTQSVAVYLFPQRVLLTGEWAVVARVAVTVRLSAGIAEPQQQFYQIATLRPTGAFVGLLPDLQQAQAAGAQDYCLLDCAKGYLSGLYRLNLQQEHHQHQQHCEHQL